MKIGSYLIGKKKSYGVLVDNGVVDLGSRLGHRYPDFLSVLTAGALSEAEAASLGQAPDFKEQDITYQSLIPAPVNCYCAGVNYLDHISETGREKPTFPTLFMKTSQAIVGHNQPIVRPKVSTKFDYEGEFAIIVGRPGRHIQLDKWRDYIAGYTILMDGSVRDYQQRSTDQGKNFFQSSSCGPWMTTLDAAPTFADMTIETRLNGVMVQHSTIDQLCIGVAALLSYYSSISELQPGDIIATGTPGGVGSRRTPPLWMKAGDVVEVEITGLGILRNPVIEER